MKRRSPIGFTIRFLCILFLSLGSYLTSSAQVDVSSSGGTMMASYTTLADAFTAINAGTHTGAITIDISGNTSEPVTGAFLVGSGTGAASYTGVLIKPTGGFARTISAAANPGIALIELRGADNVTFDGLNTGGNSLTISNTTVSATSGTCTFRFVDDAQSNTLIRCSILGSSTMSTTTNGGNIFFSTALSTAAFGNDNNIISNCKIGPAGTNLPTKGIYSTGTTTNVSNFNSNNTITNCEIFDFFNPTAQSNGIYIAGGSTQWIITNNKLFQTATRTQTTGAINACIQIANSSNENCLIQGNIIGYSSSSGVGTYNLVGLASTRFAGILITSLSANVPTIIRDNIITAVNVSGVVAGTTTAAALGGILCSSGAISVISNNTIGSLDGTSGLTVTSSSASAGEIVGIFNSSTSFVITNLDSNSIGSLSYTNTSTGGAGISALRTNLSATPIVGIHDNKIGSAKGPIKTSSNSTATGLGNQVIGIICGFSNLTCTGNTVRNLFVNTLNASTLTTSSLIGIQMGSGALNLNLSRNTIHTLYNTNTTAISTVIGLYMAPTAINPNRIENNLIHSLVNFSTSATAFVHGIQQGTTGGASYINNMIRLGIDSAGNSMTNGIQINGITEAAGTNNFYHNSVYIGGSGVSTNAANTFAFNSVVITNVRNYLNNIFYNARSNGASTGKHYAMSVGGIGLNPAGLNSNYNLLLANGTGGFTGLYDLVDRTTLANWMSATGQDCGSISSDPKFINPTGINTTVNLHISTSMATPVEGGGLPLASVTSDFDNDNRSSFSPTDIGADAGNFILSDLSPPAIDYVPLQGACGTGNIILLATISDATGVPTGGSTRPRIYYRKNAGAWFSSPGVLLTGNGMNGNWEFTILASDMAGLSVGDIVDYYVIAQDLAAPINMVSNPCGAVATNVNTIITPPPVLRSITVKDAMSGIYTVGAMGANYPTLTAAITDYNNRCLAGPVTFQLIDNSYLSETFPISINSILGQSSVNTTTIKPGAGTTPVISGSSATCIIRFNGADWVTIDGSNTGGSDRSLTLTNTNTAANIAVVCIQSLGTGLGATNNVVKNCNLNGGLSTSTSFGIHIAGTTISTSATGDDNDNNTIQNNAIKKVLYGIYSNSSAAGKNDSLMILSNEIGSLVTADQIGQYGMLIAQINNSSISKNEIFNIIGTALNPTGIRLNAGTTNTLVSSNKIHDLQYTGTSGYGGKGIDLAVSANSNITIANNFIYSLLGDGWSTITSDAIVGIRLLSASNGINVYHNTVYLSGSISRASATADVSAAFYAHSTAALLNVKNNIFINKLDNTTGVAKAYAIFTDIGGTGYSSLDNNNYFVSGPEGVLSRIGATDYLTLTDWQIAIGKDGLARNIDPLFVSATDLHLQNDMANECLNQGGMPIPAVTMDIDMQNRSLSNPDIGADEYNPGTNLLISVTETSGTANDKNICEGASATLTVSGGGIAHKWNTGESTSAITKSPASTTIYSDTVTLATGCRVVMFDTVTVLSIPTASITPAAIAICEGASTTLTASGGGTYLWDNGTTNPVRSVSPATNTTYTVTVTSANGCSASSTATVTVNSVPTVIITPAAPTICSGTTQTLTVSGGVSYSWSTGAITPSIMVTPGSTTSYTVTATASNGCTATKTVTVTVIPGVSTTETHVEPSSCISLDGSINLTVTGPGGYTYNWSTPDGSGLINGQEDQSGLSVGTYLVTVTASNGCSATRSIALVGPGNCGGCPTIGSYTTNTNEICKTINFISTASGLTNMGSTFGIRFVYSTSALADPYTMGSTLGTVPNAGLTSGGTVATLSANIPAIGSYFLYAVLTPAPPNPNCRPFKSTSIVVYNCSAMISDPCSCKNNATTLTNGQFNDIVTVNAPSGQTWTVSANTGFYLTSSPAPPAAPIIIPIGTAMTPGTVDGINNDGDGQTDEPDENVYYTLRGVHVDALGYNITVTNSAGTSSSIGSTCYYPNPTINGLASTFCLNDPAVTLNGSAQLGDGSGPAMGVGTFTVNGVPRTAFNPAVQGVGTHTVTFSFDAADGVPNGSHPGCIQAVSQSVQVNPVPTVNPVTSTSYCVGQTSPQINFTGTPATGVIYNWTRTPEAIGLAATNGSGFVPSFVTTNAGTTPLISTFTVTPSFTSGARTCTGTPITFTITVNPTPTVNAVPDVQYCHGDVTAIINFTGSTPGATYTWTRTPEAIGLAATNGVNSVPSFVTTNPSAVRITSTFTVTPSYSDGRVTCTGTPITFRISVLPQPVARCKNATLYLDKNGFATLTVPDIDNGSTARTLSLSKTSFDCGNVGTNTVTLFARDSCLKTSTCTATVTVLDTIRPTMFCPTDLTINLDPGECDRAVQFVDPYATDNCGITKSTSTASITTAFNSNNQFAGNMWNVTNLTGGPITLNSFAGNISAAVGTNCIVSIYYTPTTYVGKETNPAAWTLMGTGNAACAGINLPTLFNIGGLVIQPGETFGIYFDLVNYTAGSIVLRYTNGNITFNNGDLLLTLGVGKATPSFTGATFLTRYWNGIINYTKETIVGGVPTIMQTDNSGFKNGDIFPRGKTCLSFKATDFNGNTNACTFCYTLVEYQNPVHFLTCHDEIQISLNENCYATVGADEVLAGGPYGCYDDYRVEIRDWVTNALIDRFPNIPGVQLGSQDIGREFKITIIDPDTGNSCWGHATVEDKLPPILTCARDTCVPCGSGTTPFYTGTTGVRENCSSYSLTYEDDVTQGGCGAGFEERIIRKWTAIDGYGNKAVCIQTIIVKLATIADVGVPDNYDDVEQPALSCDAKINTVKDYTQHYLAYPYCVDGYLLDSAYWFATGGFLPSPNGDLAGERKPRTLGWNCIDTGKYIGHPSPFPIYWPAHPSWRPNNPVCWGPDEVIMWAGTGTPTGATCHNLGMTFRDIVIDVAKPGCDAGPIGCYKVIRQWTVLDWCTGVAGGHNQIIKVVDREGPQILYPDTVVANMEPWRCLGIWEVPKPWLIDNCSNEVHYTIKMLNGVVTGNETDGFVIRDIERGINEAFIYAEDCCGNITKRRIAINVIDNTPPVAVCDQKTFVSITGNQSQGENYAKAFAEDFDQGSFDNCSPHVFFKVIRMEQLRGTNNGSNANQSDNGTNCTGINGDDNALLDGNQIYFDDHVKFCCTDVGKTIMVVFRVFDIEPGAGPIPPNRMNSGGVLFNHYSDCMVEVEVQDKSVPTVVPPPNIVVSCWFWFDVDKISDPNDPTFGRVVNDLSLRHKVVTNDLVCYNYCVRNDITGYPGYVPGAPPSNPPAWNRACDFYRVLFDTAHYDRKYELVWGFDGTVLGACGTNYSISVNDNRECGQGQITRTIVARGPNGISVTGTQIIWVVDCDPFYINASDNCDPDDDITWPGNCTGQATTIDGCGADISPDNPVLGRPIIENNADDLCALISVEYVDEIFTIEPDACFKVLRHWTVIDWCQYDPSIDPTKGRWEYLQIIKVHDTDKPIVTINTGDCEPAVKNAENICEGHISIVADASDNCSPLDWLFYDYKIDLFNDGIGQHSGFEYKVGPLTRKEFSAGRTPLFHHNPAADDENNPFDASGTYPVGVHKICWYVEDGCGNIAANCEWFEIKDCKAPTPYCEVGVISVVMPSSGCVTIWAKDLDHGSFDNCTNAENLRFFFDGDTSLTSRTFCCDDFVNQGANDELIIPVQLWVMDEEGNADFCRTTILIQDPQNICPDKKPLGKISGLLKTEKDETTEKVFASLYQSGSKLKEMTTASNGSYLFGDLNYGPSMEYVVHPIRTDDPVNGVSTADIVKIQRHILGIETLNSPFKLIAADVNNSGSITASDISDIRRLVLGVTDKFAKVDSWTFVPGSYQFADPLNPWTAPREAVIQVLEAKLYSENFMAVKMGDVTNNARAHQFNGTSERTNGKLHFEIDKGTTETGEIYKIEIRSSDFNDISGYQFTLNFDQTVLSYEGFESGLLPINESNFGFAQLDKGKLTTSWDNRIGMTANPNEVLFSLVFRANAKSPIEKLVTITSDVTMAEAYDSKLTVKELVLAVRKEGSLVETGVFELYQNSPNPFAKETYISFRLPESGAAKLTIYDVTGKVLRFYDVQGVKGLNTIKILKSELNGNGVLYYQLDSQSHTATKQMLVID